MSVIQSKNLDISSMTFTVPKASTNGSKGKRAFANLGGGMSKILIQTPKMYIPNGAKRWEAKGPGENESFEVDLSFGNDTSEIASFHEKMKAYDEKLKDEIVKNSLVWTNKKSMTKEFLDMGLYVPTVKEAFDKEKNKLDYPDKMKLRLNRKKNNNDEYTGEFVSNKRLGTPILIYDGNTNSKTPIPFNEHNYSEVIPKGSSAVCLIELSNIFAGEKISSIWNLVQMKIYKNSAGIDGYAFQDEDGSEGGVDADDQDELKELESLNISSPIGGAAAAEAGADEAEANELDDDEEAVGGVEEDEEAEPEPEPTPVPKKKTRATKK